MTKKWILGTAEFGMPYGIVGPGAPPSLDEINHILESCRNGGVELIDTAPVYGESETRLGEASYETTSIDIITKTPALRTNVVSSAQIVSVLQTFNDSLTRLDRHSVYALLVHHAADLLAAGGDKLFDALQGLRERGRVKKIGVSVYSPDELKAVAERFAIDIAQVPINVLDQRFAADAFVDDLRGRGVEIHGRSIFLQGVVLAGPKELPPFLEPLRAGLKRFHDELRAQKLSPVDGAVLFALQQRCLDGVVVGVHSRKELDQILAVKARSATQTIDWTKFAVHDSTWVDPRTWPTKGGRRT